MNDLADRLAFFVVRKILPRRWLYWSAIQVAAEASTGLYSNQIVPELTVTDAIKRFRLSNDVTNPLETIAE